MDIMLHEGRWFLVQCKPRESFRAELNLSNQGLRCYHPTYPVKRKVAGLVRTVITPLFPYYLFVLLNTNDNSSTIRSTRGVSRLVTFNNMPASVDHNFILSLQLRCEQFNKSAEPLFKIGQSVMINDGCFKDLEAVVTATSGEERVTLLINLFNRQQYIDLPVYNLAG